MADWYTCRRALTVVIVRGGRGAGGPVVESLQWEVKGSKYKIGQRSVGGP